MLRSRFEKDLDDLNSDIIRLGGLVERTVGQSFDALVSQDTGEVESVNADGKEMNKLAARIENEALRVILRHQPIAGDLRAISAGLRMVADLERIGDQARDICSIVLHLCDEEHMIKPELITQMAAKTRIMVNMCISSFMRQDVNLAKKAAEIDDEVDTLFASFKESMIQLISGQPECADQAIYLMMAAKYLEKIADHAENIAGWVVFAQTGEKTQLQ
ncbi:MAG: phosphate signaling complex protein PhoU [Firmicutes bacterium]|nr:phosphate signaling complex protein PhoU [Bacillota bacterium]